MAALPARSQWACARPWSTSSTVARPTRTTGSEKSCSSLFSETAHQTGAVRRLPGRSTMGVSFDQFDGVIWHNGRLVPASEATVPVLTHGLHYASVVFEGERAYCGTVFKSTAHSERLRMSARILAFEIPYTVAEIDAAKQLVIETNNLPNAYVRPIAWRGSEMMGVSAQANRIHLAIACWEWPS